MSLSGRRPSCGVLSRGSRAAGGQDNCNISKYRGNVITILIPTYNRPGYLKRILGYYNELRVAYDIIVADGSSDETKEMNRETVSSFPSLRIQHLAKYSSETHFLHRFNDAINYVDTDYCVFCADDDFVTPTGMSQSADFLEKNPDFVAAHGRYVSFWLERRENEQDFRWQPTYSDVSITLEHPEQRLTYHLSNYSPTFYAVQRTNILRLTLGEAARCTEDYRFGELLQSALALVYGKMKWLDVLYAGREKIPGSAGRTSERLTDFMREGTYDQKYANFRECLSGHLSEQSGLDIEESNTLIDDAMTTYTKKHYVGRGTYSRSCDYRLVLLQKASRVLEHMPGPIDEGIRALYRRLFLPKQNTSLPISHMNTT